MSLQLFLDMAQANYGVLNIKDISNAADFIAAFSPNGKTSAYAYYLGIQHQDETSYRYIIALSNDVADSLPADEISTNNATFLSMSSLLALTNASVKQPTGAVLLEEFADGIYLYRYGVGPSPGNNPVSIAADATVYVIEDVLTSYNGSVIVAGSILETTASGTVSSGKVFLPSYESTGIVMLEANLLKDYANAVIKAGQVKNSGQYEQLMELLNEFRITHDRTKALVLVDNYLSAVDSFNDCRAILNHILAIV